MDVKPGMRIPDPFPGQVHNTPGGGILVSKLDDVINWARSNSLWPLVFGTSCCAIEMMSTAGAKYDWSRFGFEVAAQKGSHIKLIRTLTTGDRQILTVPNHPELDTGTCRAILRQASRYIPLADLQSHFYSQ